MNRRHILEIAGFAIATVLIGILFFLGPRLSIFQSKPETPIAWTILIPEEVRQAYAETPGEEMALFAFETATEAGLSGQTVSLSGFMVPLDNNRQNTRSFLLVAYQGACIHTPAPPPNQVVVVEADFDAKRYHNWHPITVTGEISVFKQSTELAQASYAMKLEKIRPYNEDRDFVQAEGAHQSPLLGS